MNQRRLGPWGRRRYSIADLRRHATRFWSKVDKSGDCWLWKACVDASGYGRFGVDVGDKSLSLKASRVALELHSGRILGRKLAAHRCDNRLCCRPSHLFRGTQRDNNADMNRKGRARGRFSGARACIRRHPLVGPKADVYVEQSGKVACRPCRRLRAATYRREAPVSGG